MSDAEGEPSSTEPPQDEVQQSSNTEPPQDEISSTEPPQDEVQQATDSLRELTLKESGTTENGTAACAASVPAVTRPQYDWYQTQADVYITVMVKKLKKDDVSIVFAENEVAVDIQQIDGMSCSFVINLSNSVVKEKCSCKVLSSKIELKMRKAEGLQWSALETGTEKKKKSPEKGDAAAIHKYPSSSHYARNWDQLVADVKQEEKEEKPEGDAALNKLFQQIYKDGSDEVKKAMNKSFMQSGGTVLSTNWKEVGKEKVEVKPPDGMEWKKYET